MGYEFATMFEYLYISNFNFETSRRFRNGKSTERIDAASTVYKK